MRVSTALLRYFLTRAIRTCRSAAFTTTLVRLAGSAWVSSLVMPLARTSSGPWTMTSFRIRMHRSEEHTSELQSLMRISYAGFGLTKKQNHHTDDTCWLAGQAKSDK